MKRNLRNALMIMAIFFSGSVIGQIYNVQLTNICAPNNNGSATASFPNTLVPAATQATVTVDYHGDLSSPGEFLEVYGENNTFLGQLNGGSDCSSQYTSTFTVSVADINAWASDGVVDIEVTAANATTTVDNFCTCGTPTFGGNVAFSANITLDYTYTTGPNDAGVVSVDTSLATCSPADISAVIKNYGTNQLNDVMVNWSVDSVVQTPFMFNSTLDTLNGSGSTDTSVTIGQYSFPESGVYEVKVWTSMPNGVPDTSNINDTSVVMIEADLLDLEVAEKEDVSCFGGADGYVKVTTNGYDPVFYWSSGATGDSVTNLWAETHSVIATDSVSCPDTIDVTITQPPMLEVNLLEGGSVPCYGDNQGMVSVEGQGGVGNYTYYWGNGSTDSTRNGLNVNTTHNVTVTDENGCQATASYTIFEPSELEVVTKSYNQNAGCENEIGLVSVSGRGGTTPYSYNWNNGSTSSGLNGLSAGNYTVTITDANGCTVTESYDIYDLDVSITNLRPTLIANLSGATYQWIDCNSGQLVDGATSDTFTPEEDGSYAVVITSGNCTDTSRCIEVLNTSTQGLIGGDNKSFKIYPNPTSGEFTLLFGSSAKNVEYELINAQGSVVERRVIGDVQEGQQVVGNIDAAPGIYFVRTITDQNQTISRLVVQ